MYLLMFVGVVAVDGSPVPVHIRTAARLLVPSELPHYRRRLSSRSGPDAGAVPSGHAGLHIQPVRLPAGRIYGVSSVGHFEGRSAKENYAIAYQNICMFIQYTLLLGRVGLESQRNCPFNIAANNVLLWNLTRRMSQD